MNFEHPHVYPTPRESFPTGGHPLEAILIEGRAREAGREPGIRVMWWNSHDRAS